MPKCETCGNNYDNAFSVVMHDVTHVFDSFECAIQALAPICEHCNCRIIGHGVQARDRIYCCAHCAACDGEKSLRDRVA